MRNSNRQLNSQSPMQRWDNMFVMGKSIRYVHIPEPHDIFQCFKDYRNIQRIARSKMKRSARRITSQARTQTFEWLYPFLRSMVTYLKRQQNEMFQDVEANKFLMSPRIREYDSATVYIAPYINILLRACLFIYCSIYLFNHKFFYPTRLNR